jgi:hypothetical protein
MEPRNVVPVFGPGFTGVEAGSVSLFRILLGLVFFKELPEPCEPHWTPVGWAVRMFRRAFALVAGVSGLELPRREKVARDGVEPSTFRFSVGRSYQLSYLAVA